MITTVRKKNKKILSYEDFILSFNESYLLSEGLSATH